MMSNERYKLHWITAVIEAVKTIKEMLLPLVIVIGANFFRESDHGAPWFIQYSGFIILGVAVIVLLVAGIIKWRRFEYWFEDSELRIEHGLFVRKKRYIPFDRIQSLDYTESIFHRPLKVVNVKVETAGSSSNLQSEAELTAVTREQAKQIELEIANAKKQKIAQQNEENGLLEQQDEIEETPLARKLYEMSTKDLLLLATTSGGIGVILSGAAIFLTQFSDIIPFEWLFNEFAQFMKIGFLVITILSLIGLLGVWLLSVAMTYLAYYGFTVALEKEEDLIITRGLLEKKRITVPLKRIQSISIVENPLRKLFGYATVVIHSAGGAGDSARINLFPLVKKKRVFEPLQDIFKEINFEEPANLLPKRGRHFYYRIDFIWLVPIIGAASYFLFPYGLLSLLLIPIVIAFGLWQYRAGAFKVQGNQLTLRFRIISLHTAYIKKRRIQSMEMRQSYFHRRKKVATIRANIKSGIGLYDPAVKFMEQSDAESILNWYEKRTPQSSTEASRLNTE